MTKWPCIANDVFRIVHIMESKVNLWVLSEMIASMAPLGFALALIPPATARGFDVPRVQNCLLEFSVKAHQ